MRVFFALIKKELTEQLRTGKLTVMTLLVLIFGIMNPAIAKLTPWLLDTMADTLAESGMTVTAADVTAMDSWVQFFKNYPMLLIAFVLIESGIFTSEYRTGTLVLSLTKGLDRRAVVLSKTAVPAALWTVGYFAYFGITYAYNAYYWDNSVARNLMFSVLCTWVFGLWMIGNVTFFSSFAKTGTAVLGGAGAAVFGSYLLSILPKVQKYLPTKLLDGNSLIYGTKGSEEYFTALAVTATVTAVCVAVSFPVFNRREM